jgi:signal transduction histidine kinase
MTSMKIFAQIVEKQAKKMGDAVLSDFIAKLNAQIEGLGNLINRLLDVSKLQSGKLEIKQQLFNFNDLVEEVVASMQEFATESNIVYTRETTKGLKIKADRELISQVLINLLSNAVKYSKNKGKINFIVKEEQNKIVTSIHDSGIGIGTADQEKIFQRFYRATTARENKINGAGLGLYIVKEIVEGHGGKIWFESRVDKGSIFSFTLPKE